MKNSSDTMKVLGALVIGAATGATLGVLFAPKKGSETRKNILGSAKKLTRNFKEKIDDEIKDLKKKATKEAKDLKKKVNKVENKVENKVGSLKSNLNHNVDIVADAIKS